MNQTSPTAKYLPTLDGWRALAVFAVMFSHASRTSISLGLGSERILTAFSWGRLGVDLFFAISGFLISCQLLFEFEANGRISLKAFYTRRTFRILPLYYFYLAVIATLALFAGLPVSRQELWSCVLFFRNYVIPPDGTYTNHFWSLAVEEHFYLLWPLALVLLRPRRAIWVVPPVALAIHCWRGIDSRWHLFARAFGYDTGILWRTDAHMDALLWGCFAALVCARYPKMRLPQWVPWIVIGLSPAAIICHALSLPLLMALLFPAMIVSTILCPTGLLGRFLELPPLRWVGRLSYSLYVWQTVFLQTPASPDPSWLAKLKDWPISFCMIALLSVLTHYALEKPLIRLGRRISRREISATTAANATSPAISGHGVADES